MSISGFRHPGLRHDRAGGLAMPTSQLYMATTQPRQRFTSKVFISTTTSDRANRHRKIERTFSASIGADALIARRTGTASVGLLTWLTVLDAASVLATRARVAYDD